MDIKSLIALSKKHLTSPEGLSDGSISSNAEFCYAHAELTFAGGDPKAARRWALRSLEYSVGAFHPDYQAAIN